MASAPSPEQVKPDAEYLAALKAKIDAIRAGVRDRHLKVPGLEAARIYAEAIDELFVGHLEEMARRLNSEEMKKHLAVVAVGGFGRRELALHSDIDFCFITEREPSEEDKAFIKAVLYPLWDLRLDLGYGVHSMREALGNLGKDLTKVTALLVARHLWGDPALSEELVDRMHGRLLKNHEAWMAEALRAEIADRHARFGDTTHLLEPDVKHSCGGLRDVQHFHWTALLANGSLNLNALAANGLATGTELLSLRTSWGFLIDVRNTLHLSQNRRVDRLTLERQPQVSREMGFQAEETVLPEEALMRAYYDHAQAVERLTRRMLRTALVRTPGSPENASDHEIPRMIDRDFWIKGDKIFLDSHDAEQLGNADPYWPLRYFLCAARKAVDPAEETLLLIERFLPRINEEYRKSLIARDLFLRILQTAGRLQPILQAMHRCGLLTAYIPEFALVRNLPRIDHYHCFTVDEHLIRSVGVCDQFLSDKPPRTTEHVSEVAKEVLRIDLLNLALLFHDIGKGEGRAHVIRGMHIVQRIAERMDLRPREQEVVRSLVANHQKMSHMALRRDVEDPALAKELAEAVRDPELLRMLYVHTCCDLRAVSAESWNEWRARLLAILYERTLDELRGIARERIQRAPSAQFREQVWTELEKRANGRKVDRMDIDRFLTDMPERYLSASTPARMAGHYLQSLDLTPESPLNIAIDAHEEERYVEFTFIARDAPGLFSNICGALAARRVNIQHAQVYTSKSGLVIDIVQALVPDLMRANLQEAMDKVRDRLAKLHRTGERVDWSKSIDMSAVPVSKDRLNARPPRVDVDNDHSPTHTVIEVRAPDRPGLLGDITGVFDRFSLNIDLAFISTEAYQIVDVFYVTDLETNKLTVESKLAALKEALVEAVHSGIKGV